MPRPEPGEHHDKHVFIARRNTCSEMLLGVECDVRGRRQGCLRGQSYHCRIMRFETDPAMSPSAIRRQPLPRAYRGGPHVSRPGGRTRSFTAADLFAAPTSWGLSCCDRSCRDRPFCFEWTTATPNRVQDHRQLARDCHIRPLEPDAFAQFQAPATERTVGF